MDIKKELKEILGQISQCTTIGHDDAGENGASMVALEDFEPTSEDSTDREEADFIDASVKYNGWFERLKQLSEII